MLAEAGKDLVVAMIDRVLPDSIAFVVLLFGVAAVCVYYWSLRDPPDDDDYYPFG